MLREKMEERGAVQQWIASFRYKYEISATEMLDILNSISNNLKDEVIIELLSSIQETEREERADLDNIAKSVGVPLENILEKEEEREKDGDK